MTNTLSLLAFTFLLAAGQLLFKKVGLELRAESGTGIWRLLLSPALYAALALYGVATLLWIWILSRVPLSRAYPYVALGVVLVPLASLLIFGERVRPIFWFGTVLIVAGIIVTQMDLPKG
jgi:drug/metabolite transporter (DMT)-like permease